MKNKFYYVFIVLFLVAMGGFYYVLKSGGALEEAKVTQMTQTRHLLNGLEVSGSFKNDQDKQKFDALEKALVLDLKQPQLSVYYDQNPTEENRETFKLFLGVEVADSSVNLVDSFKFREIVLNQVVRGTQNCSPQFNSIPAKLDDYADSLGLKLNRVSFFEQYSKEFIAVEMEVVEMDVVE